MINRAEILQMTYTTSMMAYHEIMVCKAVDPVSVITSSNTGHNAHANVEIKPIHQFLQPPKHVLHFTPLATVLMCNLRQMLELSGIPSQCEQDPRM